MALTPIAGVTIDGSSLGQPQGDQYEAEVNGTFSTIRLNRVGALLVQEFNRGLKIQPYTGTDLNATSAAQNRPAAEVNGRLSYRCDTGMPRMDPLGNQFRGSGGGSDSIISFTPDQWLTSGVADSQHKAILAAARRDEVLFHEMVHSVRQMAGVLNCSIAAPGFDTKEEMWSVMTTNIYCSAWNRPLRRDHHGHVTMTAEEITTFYSRFEAMITFMCTDLPRFTRAVAAIDWIPFNPFREYYRLHP